MKRFDHWYPVIALIVMDLAFAISNILLKKIVSDGMDHLVFITYRQSISAIFLSPLAFFIERGSRPKLTSNILFHLFISALVGASLTQYLFLLGIEYTSATFSCAFLNVVPVATFLMALPFGAIAATEDQFGINPIRYNLSWIILSALTFFKTIRAIKSLETVKLKYSSGRAKVLGALVCLGGAILLTVYKGVPLFHFSHPQPAEVKLMNPHGGRERWVIGSAALFAGTLCFSSWFLIQSNIGKRYPCQYSSTAIMACFSAVQSAVLSLSIDRKLSVWILKRKSDAFIVLYAGMIGSGLCFVGMSWCVKKRGPVFTAAFSPLVQIMAAIFDVPLLHEQLHLGSVIGSITVIVGLYILLWGKDRELQQKEMDTVHKTEETKEQEPGFQSIKIEGGSELS